MSFTINLARYTKEEQVVCFCLLKSLTVNINNKIDNFKTIDKKIKISHYLHTTENVQLINNISLDLNNKLYYNFVGSSDGKYLPSELVNIREDYLVNNSHLINTTKLNEVCIITPNSFIENFDNIPIFHRNGPEKNSKSEIICHFRIVIDILMKVYSQFKHKILELSDLILNLTELQDEDLDSYMNKSKSDLIKLLKEKDEEINDKNEYIDILEENLEDTIDYYDIYEDRIDTLLIEIREQREETNRRFDEQDRQHQETLRRLEQEAEQNENRFILQINELRNNSAKMMNSIENNVKTNTNNKINVTPKETQREVLRLSINKDDLANEETIMIKVNRCQKKYLKPLKSEELQLGKLLETPNAISTLNKFIETSSIEINRVTSNKLEIFIEDLELFQEEFEKFVINSQSLNELEIIPEEVKSQVNSNRLRYENLTKHTYYLDNAFRTLIFNEEDNLLEYYIKSSNRTIQILNIQNKLVGKLVKVNGITKRRVASVRLINNIYQITFRD